MRLIDKILKQRESEVLDFKREFLGSPKEYLHNLLCLANSPSRQERYLVFGVDDEKSIVGLDKKIDSSTFNNMLAQAPLNQTFSVQSQTFDVDGKIVTVIIIPENKGHLYVMKSEKYKMHPNFVYTRVGCSNTGKNNTAEPARIEQILAKRLSKITSKITNTEGFLEENKTPKKTMRKHQDVIALFHRAIKDYEGWESIEEFEYARDEHVTTYFYKYNMAFIIKSYPHLEDFNEPWAQDAPDSNASAYTLTLYYDKQKIGEKYYASTDGGRYLVTYPETVTMGGKPHTRYFYYIRDSFNYDLNYLINKGRSLYLNRMQSVEIPVFESESEAKRIIEGDYSSGRRLILSYTFNAKSNSKSGVEVRNYTRYPRCSD